MMVYSWFPFVFEQQALIPQDTKTPFKHDASAVWFDFISAFEENITWGIFVTSFSVSRALLVFYWSGTRCVLCKAPAVDPCSYETGTHLLFPAHACLALGCQKGAVSFVQQSCHFYLVLLLCMKYHTKCCGITLLRPSEVIVPWHYLSCSCNLLKREFEKIEMLTKHEGTSTFLIKVMKQMGRFCLLVTHSTINVLAAQKKKNQNEKIFLFPNQSKNQFLQIQQTSLQAFSQSDGPLKLLRLLLHQNSIFFSRM